MASSVGSEGARGAATGSPAPPASSARRRVSGFDELGVLLALGALVALIGIFHSEFLRTGTLLDTARQAAFVAIIAYGMVFLLAMGELDLSVGGTYAVTLLVPAIWMSHGMNPWIAAVLGIVLGLGLGLFNGILSLVIGVPVIIITLGTLSMYRGIASITTRGSGVEGIPIDDSFFSTMGGDLLGVPASVITVVLLGAGLTVVFRTTRFGAMVRAVGSNAAAARYAGIPIRRTRLLALTLTGGLAGVAGVLSLAYFQAADPTVGGGFELQVIAAAVIGGTAVTGGSGTVPGALIGALIVAVINSGLVFFSIPDTWTNFVTGGVIVLAVGLDALIRRRRQRALMTAG